MLFFLVFNWKAFLLLIFPTGEDSETIVANNSSGNGSGATSGACGAISTDTTAPSGAGSKQNNTAVLLVGQSLSRILVTLRSIEDLMERVLRREIPMGVGGVRQTEEQIKWKAVGAVMDRFFMVAYIVIICVSLTFLLPRAQTMWKFNFFPLWNLLNSSNWIKIQPMTSWSCIHCSNH